MIYTDHEALKSIMFKVIDGHGRIVTWQDRLKVYDYGVHHRPARNRMIAIADDLSRLPPRLTLSTIRKEGVEELTPSQFKVLLRRVERYTSLEGRSLLMNKRINHSMAPCLTNNQAAPNSSTST